MVTADASIKLLRRARWLAWATIVYNVIEAVVAIVAGSVAGSIALIGFGLDSIVEVLSALVIVWQLNGVSEDRERTALKLIALSFYLLASYVAVRALFDLIGQTKPDTSLVGIGLAISSALVMPILARAKRHTGEQLGSSTGNRRTGDQRRPTSMERRNLYRLLLSTTFTCPLYVYIWCTFGVSSQNTLTWSLATASISLTGRKIFTSMSRVPRGSPV